MSSLMRPFALFEGGLFFLFPKKDTLPGADITTSFADALEENVSPFFLDPAMLMLSSIIVEILSNPLISNDIGEIPCGFEFCILFSQLSIISFSFFTWYSH